MCPMPAKCSTIWSVMSCVICKWAVNNLCSMLLTKYDLMGVFHLLKEVENRALLLQVIIAKWHTLMIGSRITSISVFDIVLRWLMFLKTMTTFFCVVRIITKTRWVRRKEIFLEKSFPLSSIVISFSWICFYLMVWCPNIIVLGVREYDKLKKWFSILCFQIGGKCKEILWIN